MRTLITILIATVSVSSIYAQETRIQNQEVAPKQGVAKLALEYYGIEFSAEQRQILAEKPLELIYTVDEQGGVTLGKVKGIQDAGIIDSFERVSAQLAPFKPMIRNGKAEQSVYFMQLEFPEFGKKRKKVYRSMYQDIVRFRGTRMEDFEYVELSENGSDISVGGLMNGFLGNASEHLGFGGGMYMDIMYKTKTKYSIGLHMNGYGNKLRKSYPVHTVRQPLSYPPTLITGLSIGKWIRPDFNIRGDVSYALHTITERLADRDPYALNTDGFSIGTVATYKVQLGGKLPSHYYGSPVVFSHNLECKLGIRYIKHGLNSASGVMIEAGVGYMLSMQEVLDFAFKN